MENAESVMKVKTMADTINAEVLDIYHEDFIKDPKAQLNKLCLWLGIKPSSNYLADCATIVFTTPQKKRYKIEWNESLKQRVESKIKLFPFLEGYTFDS